jgi:hypothetical protein
MFVVFFAFVYFIVAAIVFPFKKILCPNCVLFRPLDNERVVPDPGSDHDLPIPDNVGDLELRNARLLIDIRQGRVGGSRMNDLLMEANNSAVDAEAIIRLRRRMRRDRVTRRRLNQLETDRKYRPFSAIFTFCSEIIVYIDQNDFIENQELNAIIRNMSLYNRLNEFSTIYQKEHKYYEYLRKELDKDIDPFPDNCAVCLSEFEEKDNIIKVNCETMHVFHTN